MSLLRNPILVTVFVLLAACNGTSSGHKKPALEEPAVEPKTELTDSADEKVNGETENGVIPVTETTPPPKEVPPQETTVIDPPKVVEEAVMEEDPSVTIIPIPPLFGDHKEQAQTIKSRRCGTKPTQVCLRNRTIVDKYRFARSNNYVSSFSDAFKEMVLRRQRLEKPTYSKMTLDIEFTATFYDSIEPLTEVFKEGSIYLCGRYDSDDCIRRERCFKARYYSVVFGLIEVKSDEFHEHNSWGDCPIFIDPKDPRKGIDKTKGINGWDRYEKVADSYGDLYDWDIGGMELIIKPESAPKVDHDQFLNIFRCNRAKFVAGPLKTPENQSSFDDPKLYPIFKDKKNDAILGWDECDKAAPSYEDRFEDISNW